MAVESPEKREASASDSSEDQGHAEIDGTHLDHADSNGSNNGSSASRFSRVNTLPAEKYSAKLEPDLAPIKLERSRTERQRHSNILASEAAQIFDDKIPVQQKLKLLNRIATVKDDGTVEFEVPGDAEPHAFGGGPADVYPESVDEESLDATDLQYIPPLQIVMLIVGTRGDVQPFIAIGKKLQDYGHRVRLATHANFKEFVLTAGLEFFPLGGDPKVLAGYMVKNKGFLPSGPSEIPVQRNQIKEIIYSLLPACKDPDLDSGVAFKADAIIANPPAYGHTHVAEALKVPLHIFFTMPWTPTSEFPHPLSRVKQPSGYRLSYQIVDSLIWLGIRDMINDVRKKKLKLRPVTYLSGSQGSESDIPHGYIWSPHLVPKPKDWGPKVDVVGFCFLDLASNYEPPQPLVEWLNAGPKPIYIGFGSLPVQEPEKMTQIIVEALEITGQRGVINKRRGGLRNLAEPKESIYVLDNCPHDWLFPRCAAVVHHGGAGTTAADLKAACPTAIVPFFGDQPFWGDRVHARGVRPPPIPVDEFSLPKLVDAINFMLDPKEFRSKEREIARRIKQITGSVAAVRSKANELVKLFNDPHCPQSVTVAMFAKKVISIYETPTANFNSSAFACGHVIVYISAQPAQVPAAMDCLLAEFHKACIYTVPKHVIYSKADFEAKEAYFKAIGYREEEGKLETTEKYLERLGSYMKLYGALVQTEAQGVQNMHGLEEGWVWLARFLNNLPANVYTAVALEAFLRMAGFALHRKYKSQFKKILKAISEQFMQALKDRGDPRISSVITRLQDYIESNAFLKEPEGWRLKDSLLSSDLVPDADHHQQHYYSQDRHFYYQR